MLLQFYLCYSQIHFTAVGFLDVYLLDHNHSSDYFQVYKISLVSQRVHQFLTMLCSSFLIIYKNIMSFQPGIVSFCFHQSWRQFSFNFSFSNSLHK